MIIFKFIWFLIKIIGSLILFFFICFLNLIPWFLFIIASLIDLINRYRGRRPEFTKRDYILGYASIITIPFILLWGWWKEFYYKLIN